MGDLNLSEIEATERKKRIYFLKRINKERREEKWWQ